jgi:hypothetical protein
VKIRPGIEEKSRLGRLLINRGYLTEDQLKEGLGRQRETGQRLGEIFVQSGWVTEKELVRILKHQTRYRNAAALFTVVTLPLQPLVSFAASNNVTAAQVEPEAGELYDVKGLSALTEDEMSGVSGQADSKLMQRISAMSSMVSSAATGEADDTTVDVIEGIKLTANIFVPVLNFLDSDFSISGVHYREGEPRFTVREDGALTLAFPERIEEIRMDNIRVSGSHGPSMGNVSISDIRFDPASQMTIYTR